MSNGNVQLIGSFGWVMQPGYPELSGDDGAETITVRYKVTRDAIQSIPLPGSTFYSPEHPFFNMFPRIRLKTRNVKTVKGNLVYDVTLVYAYPPGAEPMGDTTVHEELEYDTNEFTAPLSANKNYRTRWDHQLIGKTGEDGIAAPDFWEEAKTTAIPASFAGLYAWKRPDDKTPDKWALVHDLTKPNVEGYETGTAVVSYTLRSTSKAKLVKRIADDFHISSPPDTFGAAGEWLRGGSKMRKEGRYWCQTVTYKNAKVIDRDLYDAT